MTIFRFSRIARTIRSAAAAAPGKQLRVVQAAHLGFEERDGPGRVFDPAVDQQLGDQRREPGAPAQALDAPGSREASAASGRFGTILVIDAETTDLRGIRTSSDAAHKSR